MELIEKENLYRQYLKENNVENSSEKYITTLKSLYKKTGIAVTVENFMSQEKVDEILNKLEKIIKSGFKDCSSHVKKYQKFAQSINKPGKNDSKIIIEKEKELKKFWSDDLNLTENVVASYLTYLRKIARNLGEDNIDFLSFNPTDAIELQLLELKEKNQITPTEFNNWRSALRAYQKFIDSLIDEKETPTTEVPENENPYELINGVIKDGIAPLLKLISTQNDNVEEFFIKSVYYISPENVRTYWNSFIANKQEYKLGTIRYNSRKFKNSSRQLASLSENAIIEKHKIRGEDISLKISGDKDGNYAVRRMFKTLTKLTPSQGNLSNVTHYTLTHIWGQVDNPLFFESPWNVALTPTYISALTDGKFLDETHVRSRFQSLFQAVAYQLYKDIFKEDSFLNVDLPNKEILDIADSLIKNKLIKTI